MGSALSQSRDRDETGCVNEPPCGQTLLGRVRHPSELRKLRQIVKKMLVMVISFIVVVALGCGAYICWSKATFVSREIKSRTGAKEVHVIYGIHTEDHWYGKAEIDEQVGKQLFERYKWERGFEKKTVLAGRVISDRPLDCLSCFYRLEIDPHDREYHPYNYTVYVLSPDLKTVEVYDQFGS